MPDITPQIEIDINKELVNLQLYKNHPNGILNASLNRLKDMLDGRVEVVDPSNPFIYLLETTCLNTAFAIQEMTLLTRKLYPRLANSEDDLYLHMSDKDYIGRFSSPARTDVRFNLLFNSFKTNAHKDPVTGDYLHTIPKNFKVTVDNYIFTLSAPILIRVTEHGVIDIRYLAEQNDDVFELGTTFINFGTLTTYQGESYISFDVPMQELDLEATEIPVEKSKLFKGTLNFNQGREFYHFKAYHLTPDGWSEMITTHTEQVYDIETPTCILKVNQTEHSIDYYVPPVYVNSGRLGSKVKFVVYTTLGPINVNFADYKTGDFKTQYNPVFPDTDLDDTTQALQLIPKVVFIEGKVTDGKGPKSFSALKADVIDNNLGKNHRPITNVQVDRFMDGSNFKLVRNVDNVTNRIFLLEAKLPASPSRYGVSKLNLGIIEYASTIDYLRDQKNSIVTINPDITLLPEGTLFVNEVTGLRILNEQEAASVKALSGNALVKHLNTASYLSLYYHYVLDTSGDTTVLRAYDISQPKLERTNFKGFNATTRIGINTVNTNIVKTSTGFQLDILANIRKYDAQYDETNLTPYVVYRDTSDGIFFLEGRLYTTINENPVYRFQFNSQYHIDNNNRIYIQNFKDINGSEVEIAVGLESELEIIYLTNRIPSMFEASHMDSYIRTSYLAVGNAVVTLESMTFIFGRYLEHLYTRVHTSTGTQEYEVWEDDVPLLYEKTVYNSNNEIVHRRNEPVLTDLNEPVYKYRKGEYKYDDNGKPILAYLNAPNRYLNLLFIDYKAIVANDSHVIEYRDYLKRYITSMIVNNVKDIQPQLIEPTVAYMTVPANVGNINITYNGRVGYVPAAQSFALTLYVNQRTYEETETRRGLELVLIEELEKYLSDNRKLSRSTITSLMLSKVSDFVKSIGFDQFTEANAEYIELLDEGTSFSFNKVLVIEPDGYHLRDDVTINFVLVN